MEIPLVKVQYFRKLDNKRQNNQPSGCPVAELTKYSQLPKVDDVNQLMNYRPVHILGKWRCLLEVLSQLF